MLAETTGSNAPAIGACVEVSPGIRWLRMAVPGDLDHINLWVLGGRRRTLVDAGLGDADTRAAWTTLLAGPLAGAVEQLIVTHQHPDHAGATDWLVGRLGCRLLMTSPEYDDCLSHIAAAAAPPDAPRAFLRLGGWDDAMLDAYLPFHGRFGLALGRFPSTYQPLVDGEEIEAGGRRWQVIVTRGHSPAHACLFDPDARVLIAGDQILPSTAAVVPVTAAASDADPLGDWFTSLDRLAARLPGDTLVLPSHGLPFTGPHVRIAAIAEGHRVKLDRARAALAAPRTAAELVRLLYRREANGRTVTLMTGEAMAYANHLIAVGEASATVTDGVRRYARR